MVVARRALWIIASAAIVLVGLAAWAQIAANRSSNEWTIRVAASFPHDATAYTQGLAISDGQMYEGTGQYGRSSIRRVEIDTGRVERIATLSPEYFGEAITVTGDHIYQLTWKSRLGFVYQSDTFQLQKTFRIDGEGWGLTHNDEHLILSDGSSEIQFLDPETLAVVRRIAVRDSGQPVDRLNELEYIRGEIWANVWFEDRIVRISPTNGEVLGWIDLTGLYPRAQRNTEDVLNGIAFDPATERLFVTGKNWPRLYEIELIPKEE